MFYVLWAISVAASLAASGIATELGTKYVALYFVENEPADLGVKEASPDASAADRRADAAPETRVRAVAPVLFSSTRVAAAGSPPPRLSDRRLAAEVVQPARYVVSPRLGEELSPAENDDPPEVVGNRPLTTHPALPVLPDQVETDAIDEAHERTILGLARDTPYRDPDGTAFLPIGTQRLFAMRWQVVRRADVPIAIELPGHVSTDPSTGRIVPAVLSGVIEAHKGSFPYLGMAVRAGDVLAYLRPTMSAAELAQINARMEQLVNEISLAEKQIERLQEVLFVRYRPNKIEALKLQIDGDRRELVALQSSLEKRVPLRATADGVISHIGSDVGGSVSQGQEVFEIVDPSALWVEAAAYDPSIASSVSSAAALTGDGHLLELQFIGGGLLLTNQAVPLRFRILNAPEGLTVGIPVTVIVRQEKTISGISVPTSSVVRDSDGGSVVWERLSAETFAPRRVRATQIAGNVMVVQSGISSGSRIVVNGAIVLNQIR